jgi:hypothetical protein
MFRYRKGDSSKKYIILAIVSFSILAVIPGAESNYYHYIYNGDHYFQESIWLFLYSDNFENSNPAPPSIIFGTNANYVRSPAPPGVNYDISRYFEEDYDYVGEIEIRPAENLTVSNAYIDLTWTGRVDDNGGNPEDFNADITFQLRFDGDGDGNFEFIINFKNPKADSEAQPTSTSGQPIELTDGTIELIISRADTVSSTFKLWCTHHHSFIQTPFDFDTDGDGIGDYSDPNDDNDGYPDSNDVFLRDKNEWKDSDWDGIGDNADEDANGNLIPDDFELPLLAVFIVIAVIIIIVFLRRRKKGDEPIIK